MFLDLEGLTKRYGAMLALNDVSLTVEEGEFVCFLGPSGCGKTTLLRCIAGLEIQDRGTLRQKGEDISQQPPAQRDFGVVFQSYALFPNLTVEKNIAYGLTGRAWTRERVRQRVEELLTLVGLAGHEHKYPTQLSGGQQQRVALARALAPSPALLLLDEPLSALDAKVRERLRREIKDLHRRLGVTTIMVTHDQEEALTMADRIVVINEGRVEQIGSPAEIYGHPANPFVADFIGTMNFLQGHTDENGLLWLGESWKLQLNGKLPSGLAAGEPITCCVRPENLLLSRDSVEQTNICSARLRSIEYLGSLYRAEVSPAERNDLVLRVDLAAKYLHTLAPTPNERLNLYIPSEALHLFPTVALGV